MKKLLPILLCYILMTSQVFAISGGPVFGSGSVNPVGTYSGVITVNTEYNNTVNGNAPAGPVATINAIGLFTLGVPSTSVAQGAALIFVEGIVYTGTITATINPDSDKLVGILNATYAYTLVSIVDGVSTSTSITAQANGQVNATIAGTRQGSTSSATLTGTSTLQLENGGVNGFSFTVNRTLGCKVTGFRQSTTASTATTL